MAEPTDRPLLKGANDEDTKAADIDTNSSADAHAEESVWDADWEGVPRPEDDFIQKFVEGRNALIEAEKQRRSGL